VEDVDILNIKDLLMLLTLFKDDLDFKKFLAYNLKERILKTPNINMRELMSAIVETLELEDLRGEVLKYALNAEVFYAFPISYLISLLHKISIIGAAEDIKDLLKTIQIQLCLKHQELALFTIKRLISIHYVLPILH
jgi:hypothetical protein